MTPTWWAVIVATLACYLTKLAGHSVPQSVLDRPLVKAISDALPIALLMALVAVQTFAVGQHLVLDARVAGLSAAVVALLLRAPFLVVVVVAAATAAIFRAMGWAV
ncbi:MAG: AzlD domain-containing protein [Candidatus Nanopelagicales bacterium]